MIAVEIEDEAWARALPEVERLVEGAAVAAVEGGAAGPAGIAVLLTDDDAVRDLNARFRDKDKPTNVLSFPAAESAAPHLGDIALAYGVCAREAEAQGKTIADHLSHLVVHGTLHLLGYDHEADADAEVMEDMERQILSRLGVMDPYGSDLADVRS